MFKPKKKEEELEEVPEEQEELEVEEEVEEDNIKEEPKEQSSKLTIQEVVDMIEGHLSRANQLLQLLK